jgi:hypothetical protein
MILVPLTDLLAKYSLYHFPGMTTIVFLLSFLGLGLVYDQFHKIFDSSNIRVIQIYFVCCFLPILISIVFHQYIPNIGIFTGLLYACVFLSLKDNYRHYIYHYFIKILSIVLLCGIIESLICTIIGHSIFLGYIERNQSSGIKIFEQGIFNIYSTGFRDIIRFQSLTDEPGRIGTLCGFLLFTINPKEYKREYIIFIIAGLLSFSFAFYVLSVIYLISNITFKKIWISILTMGIIALFYLYFQESVDKYIVQRYYSEEYDNRVSDNFQNEFDRFITTNEIFFGKGYGSKDDERWNYGGNTGLKSDIYQVGIVCFLMFFLMFSYLFVRYNKINYKTIVLILVIWISYYQRSDGNFSPNIVIFFANNYIFNLKNNE